MFGSWGRCARFCALFLTLSFGASPAMAQACNFKVDTAVMSERLRVDILRCLVNELAAVRRENDLLKRRLRDIEALMTELPAAYSNEDGVVTEVPGRAIGRASFVLSARSTGGANAMPVDQRVLDEVCGRSGGCAVSIAFRQISLFDAESKASVLTGP